MTIKERIKHINALDQDQCWYITKHNLDFKQLCFSAQIVELYQASDKSSNFEGFYTKKASDFNLSDNHRATNNCYYLGLLENNGQYKDAKPTNAYYKLKESVQGDFSKLNLTDNLVVNQLEKTFISNPIDREYDGLRKSIRINPAFFLARVLISIGEITNDYQITLDEFYLFVGTSETYRDHYIVTQLIIENRETSIKITNKFTNNRLHLLLENLPYFSREGSLIKFSKDYKELLLEKLYRYETLDAEEVFTTHYLHNFLPVSFTGKNSIQKIYYGAPGTGKSHKVKEIVFGKDERTERVTFHPEYDYTSFVGGYKPTMDGDNIRYEFVPQAFTNIYTKAWNDPDNDYYLVIEEINRGNCAEIFGDIFQLLDRTNDYKITPSKELKEFLKIELKDNLSIDAEKLLLPPNLNILATMNTSDQSLFPMDSAFKRRWDWEYIPINYESTYIDSKGEEKENESANYSINLPDGNSFKWLDFIKSVNNNWIGKNENLGMDKCLGNYFIKSETTEITLNTFVNKAVFYLWNDVFKDEMEEQSIFKDKTTYEDFFPIETDGLSKVKEILEILEVEVKPT